MAIDSIGGSYRSAVPPVVPSGNQDSGNRRQIEKLKAIEQSVISHELAHKGAGGAYAGGASYTYTTGPDGKRYITGGEVSIDLSPAGSPEATARKMRQVAGAALAPVDPSAQDYRVAARAAALELEASRQAADEAGGGSQPANPVAARSGSYSAAGRRSDDATPSVSLYA